MLFAVALHSVANDYFAEKQAEQDIYMAMSTMKGDTHETVSSPQTPYFPDAVLSQHWGKLYETTTSYCCHPVSEYYVFALRRIIV